MQIPANGIPHLAVIRQQSSSTTRVVDTRGTEQTVHLVVKNSPFNIQLGLFRSSVTNSTQKMFPHDVATDISKIQLDVKLLFDMEEEKEVNYVKVKPFEHKVALSDSGDSLNVELRLKVLTSQHEDMHFRVKFTAVDPGTKALIPYLYCLSEPIKVISKPEQSRKRRKSSTPSKKKAKTTNDILLERLGVIAKAQDQQQVLLNHLMADRSHSLPCPPPAKKIVKEEKVDFETAFKNLVSCLHKLPKEAKTKALQKLVTSSLQVSKLVEFHDLLMAEGLHGTTSSVLPMSHNPFGTEFTSLDTFGWGPAAPAPDSISSMQPTVGCTCAECPHKVEVERHLSFYSDAFSVPL